MMVAFAAVMTVFTVAIAFAVIAARTPVVIVVTVVVVVIAIRIAIIITPPDRLIVTIATITAANAYADATMPAVVMPVARRSRGGDHCCDRSSYHEDEFHFHNIAHFKFHAWDRRDNA